MESCVDLRMATAREMNEPILLAMTTFHAFHRDRVSPCNRTACNRTGMRKGYHLSATAFLELRAGGAMGGA